MTQKKLRSFRPVKAVLFDLDGVLIDSAGDIRLAINWTLEQFGLPPLSQEVVNRHIGYGASTLVLRCFNEYGKEHGEAAKAALPLYLKHYQENSVVETSLYDGVREGLTAMSCFRKAVVTNKPGSLASAVLETLGVRQYFDVIIAPEQVSRMKPDPEGLVLAMSLMEAAPDQTVMVGDSASDIEAGFRAGTRTAGAFWGIGDPEKLCAVGPDINCVSFEQLSSWLLGGACVPG